MCKKVAKSFGVLKKIAIFAVEIHKSQHTMTQKPRTTTSPEVAVIAFRKGDEWATVVTDGNQTRSFTMTECRRHEDVMRAIGFLESHGYEVLTDVFTL